MTESISRSGSPWLEIVIPARNEQTRLPSGLERIAAKAAQLPPGVQIIVVDSASTDHTAQLVLDWPAGPVPVRLVRCERPGKGAAVRAGLLATTAAYVGYCDADMATDLAGLDLAIEQLQAGRQIVVGSRAHPASVVEDRHSLVRKTGAAVFRAAAALVVSGPADTQCGFKFFAGPLARRAAADLVCTGFAFDVELMARGRQLGADLAEIPVQWRDVPGSTFSVWRHSLAAFGGLAGIWLALRSRSSWDSPEPVAAVVPAPAGAVGTQ